MLCRSSVLYVLVVVSGRHGFCSGRLYMRFVFGRVFHVKHPFGLGGVSRCSILRTANCERNEVPMRYDELQDEIKNAMRAKDKPKLSILRQVHGEIKNIEVNERRDITDADVDAMLKRLIKQTKETLDGSIKAGNDQERTDTLTAQVAILESYLPKQVSGDELAALIDEVLTETGASSKKDMGRVMGALTQKTGGNFDKAAAAKELGQKLA